MSENEKLVRNFIEAWWRLDVDELVGFFTDDGVYHNMPIQPVEGKNDLKNFIGGVHIDLPCCGVFELESGKIKVWRDYFDMATFTGPLTPQ